MKFEEYKRLDEEYQRAIEDVKRKYSKVFDYKQKISTHLEQFDDEFEQLLCLSNCISTTHISKDDEFVTLLVEDYPRGDSFPVASFRIPWEDVFSINTIKDLKNFLFKTPLRKEEIEKIFS